MSGRLFTRIKLRVPPDTAAVWRNEWSRSGPYRAAERVDEQGGKAYDFPDTYTPPAGCERDRMKLHRPQRGLRGRFWIETGRILHLAQTRDALNRIGTLLYRGSLKYTFITSVATGIGHELPRLGLPGLNTVLAVALPALVFVLAFGGGLSLKYIPNIISLGRIATAEAADFNLMKDYRKSQMDSHLDVLWERIFKYEARINYAPEEIEREERLHRERIPALRDVVCNLDEDLLEYLGVGETDYCCTGKDEGVDDLVEALLCAHPQCKRMEKTKRAFLTSARYALREHIEQEEQTDRIGFDLSQWEDWRDSAYFHSSDEHLSQQYDANATLEAVKKELGWSWVRIFAELPKKTYHKLWFRLLTRAISVNLGACLNELDEKYLTKNCPETFKAQLIMWPGAEKRAHWLHDLPCGMETRVRRVKQGLKRLYLPGLRDGQPFALALDAANRIACGIKGMYFSSALEEVRARRKHLIHSRFGKTYRDALEVIDRAYLPPFELATDLRVAYDAEYAAGMLEQTPTGDLGELGAVDGEVERRRRKSEKTAARLRQFLEFAEEHEPRVGSDPEARRSVAVAFHTNRRHVKWKFRGSDPDYERVRSVVEEAMDASELTTARLYAVRMHQVLSFIQIKQAREYIRDLAYEEERQPAGDLKRVERGKAL